MAVLSISDSLADDFKKAIGESKGCKKGNIKIETEIAIVNHIRVLKGDLK